MHALRDLRALGISDSEKKRGRRHGGAYYDAERRKARFRGLLGAAFAIVRIADRKSPFDEITGGSFWYMEPVSARVGGSLRTESGQSARRAAPWFERMNLAATHIWMRDVP